MLVVFPVRVRHRDLVRVGEERRGEIVDARRQFQKVVAVVVFFATAAASSSSFFVPGAGFGGGGGVHHRRRPFVEANFFLPFFFFLSFFREGKKNDEIISQKKPIIFFSLFFFFLSFEKREKRMAKLVVKKDFAREELHIYSSHKDGKGGTENRDDHRRVRIRGRRRRRCGHESVHGYVSLSLLLCLEGFLSS